ENDFRPYLIVNPQAGKSEKDPDFFLTYLNKLDDCKFIHAFIYVNNKAYIENAIDVFGIEECMVVGLDTFSNEEEFKSVCQIPQVSSIMLLDPGRYRGLDRFIKTLNKEYIRLDDLFEKQSKNAD